MTVYPTADDAAMNYVLLDKPAPTERAAYGSELWQKLEVEFRLKLIRTNMKAAKQVINGVESDAYKLGYLAQTLTQINIDLESIERATNALYDLVSR